MNQAVIIKSSKCGITLVLNPELEFDVLLTEILKKFYESEKFFSNAKLALAFEGRTLTDEEKYRIVEAITAYTSIDIICIMENDELRDAAICQKIKEQIIETEQQRKARGSFYRGSLLPGEHLETEESIIILGDVPSGATVVSKSNILVLGSLQGSAYAGMEGNKDAFLAALDFMPERCNIAGIYGGSSPKEKHAFFPKRNKTPEPKLAFVKDGFIIVRSLYEGFENKSTQ